MNNKYILESLASDLKRVALGLHRGSTTMSQKFMVEALKRKEEVEMKKVSPYIRKILLNLNNKIDADNALMYSTLIQNYIQCKKYILALQKADSEEYNEIENLIADSLTESLKRVDK